MKTAHPHGDAPRSIKSGGQLFTAKWKDWIGTTGLKRKSANLYTRKLKHVIKFLEQKMAYFKMDSLLYPLEFKVSLPTIGPMKKAAKTEGERKVVCLTYLYVCELVLEIFDERYAGDSGYSLQTKTMYKLNIQNESASCSRDLKHINSRQALITAMNKARKEEDPNDLSYNPDRMKDVAHHVVFENHTVKKMIDDLIKCSPEEIEENYEEVNLRYLLMSLILASTGGLRPEVVSCIKIGEFLTAKKQTNGTYVAMAEEHKLFKKLGPQPIPFSMERLHEAVERYLHLFRDSNQSDGYLFATKNGLPTEVKHSRDWLRKNILKDFLTPEESRLLKPGSWRKGYSNWAEADKDVSIKENGPKIMMHSDAINRHSYLRTHPKNAAEFGNKMMKRVSFDLSHKVHQQKLTTKQVKDLIEKARAKVDGFETEYKRVVKREGDKRSAVQSIRDSLNRRLCEKSV